MVWLLDGEKISKICLFVLTIHERDTQTDGHRMAAYTALCIASRGKNYDNMLSRFHLIPERYGQADRRTDRQTDRFAISISRVSMLTRDKNQFRRFKDVDELPRLTSVK